MKNKMRIAEKAFIYLIQVKNIHLAGFIFQIFLTPFMGQKQFLTPFMGQKQFFIKVIFELKFHINFLSVIYGSQRWTDSAL